MIAVSVLVASMPLAVAQQYPPPAYPNPEQSPGYPGAAQPPAYSGQGYGGPGGSPPPQQEAIPPPPGAAMVWQPGYWSWSRHGWCGCPAVMFPARTRAPIRFPVTGPNDTGAGFGCRNTGDDIDAIVASRNGRIGPAVEQEADRCLDLRAGETPVRGGNAMQHGCLHV